MRREFNLMLARLSQSERILSCRTLFEVVFVIIWLIVSGLYCARGLGAELTATRDCSVIFYARSISEQPYLTQQISFSLLYMIRRLPRLPCDP